MKKLSTTPTAVPELHLDEIQPDEIPILKRKSSSKLGEMKSIKKLNKLVQKNGQIDVFLDEQRGRLNASNSDDYYLNTVVLKEIMQASEKYFVYGNAEERNKLKDEAVSFCWCSSLTIMKMC